MENSYMISTPVGTVEIEKITEENAPVERFMEFMNKSRQMQPTPVTITRRSEADKSRILKTYLGKYADLLEKARQNSKEENSK